MNNINRTQLIFWTVALVLVFYRLIIALNWHFQFADEDQFILWQATKDFTEGKIMEPRFYGQNYNSTIEALFAAPLYTIGIPIWVALPLVSMLFIVSSFVYFALLVSRKKGFEWGIVFLCIAFLLPLHYDVVTQMPRGFVTGIVVLTPFFYLLVFPENNKKLGLWIFVPIAYSINQNILFLVLPFIVYYFFTFRENHFKMVFYLVIGYLISLPLDLFYVLHPEYKLHGYELKVDWGLLQKGLTHLDDLYADVMPLFWNQGWMFFVLMVLFFYGYARKKNRIKCLSIAVLVIFILATLCLTKTHDGYASVYFSLSRTALVFPFVLMWFLLDFVPAQWKAKYALVFGLPVVCLVLKCVQFEEFKEKEIKNSRVVSVWSVGEIQKHTERFQKLVKRYKPQVVLVENSFNAKIYAYASTVLCADFPPVVLPVYERRTALMKEVCRSKYNRIMRVELFKPLDSLHTWKRIQTPYDIFYLRENNGFKMRQFFRKEGIAVRPI